MPVPSLLAHAVTLAVYLKYPLIFLGTSVGGPFLILASGFLLRAKLLDLVPLFISLSFGELTLDMLWYFLGYRYADRVIGRFGKYFAFTPDLFEKIKTMFDRHHAITLFLNKIFMGFGMGIAILITAGATKMRFSTYMSWNVLGEIVWVSIMLYIGYFYAGLYAAVSSGLRIAFLAGTVVLMTVVIFGLSRHIRETTLKRF